jgi:hypothetical protein
MTYNDYDISANEAKPIELYDIYDSDGTHYRKHTGDADIIYMGQIYSKGIVDRTEIIIGGEIADDNTVTITLERGDTLAARFIPAPIDGLVFVNIYRQYEDTYSKLWSGYLTFAKYDENVVPSLIFENILSSFVRMGHRRRCSRLCNHALYKTGCNVNQELYKVTGTISNISGLVITSSAFATESGGYWVGGKIRVGNAYRLIKAHTTNTITIDRLFADVEIGNSHTTYAGCGHTPTLCLNKFGNKINFGGNEFLPYENPFGKNIEL